MAEENNNFLFSQEELESMEAPHLFNQKHEGPITVLGHTFENDDERRAFFREELRKKLPELKKIEGYPIGEDDDIVALSDPPYYTACPNPWLNDFVVQWEEEKKGLKRDREKVVTEPYASDVSVGKSNPIYNAHSYHTKVPHPAIMRYILHYTKPGDIVLDGFAGTGMTGVAAKACGNPDPESKAAITKEFNKQIEWGARHAICGDLSPIASFISSNYNIGINAIIFKKELQRILKELEDECGWMYKTKGANGKEGIINYTVFSDVLVCPHCGKEYVFWDAAVDKDKGEIYDDYNCPFCNTLINKRSSKQSLITEFDSQVGQSVTHVKTIPVIVNYETLDGKRYEKTPDADDLALIEKIEHTEIPYWYPTGEIADGDKTQDPKNHHVTHFHHFFTKRNLYSLSKFYSLCKESRYMMLLTGVMSDTSRMARMKIGYYFHGGGGPFIPGLSGTLYIPSLSVEKRVSFALGNRLDSLIKAFSFIGDGTSSCVYTNSATQLNIDDNSIDYIFTDPPFGANIMYSELNSLSESWLKVLTNDREEAIENKNQHKGLFEYQGIMQHCFAEYYRVLKPGHWITIEFSNTSASVWNSIQNALQGVGFVIANVAGLDKKQGSFNAVTSTTAVKQDLVITCYKPSSELLQKFDNSSIGSGVWDFIEEYLEHLPISIEKGNKTTTVVERSPKILYDRLISYFVQRGLPVPLDASDFQAGLRDRYASEDGMFFTPSQLAEYREIKKRAPEFVSMGLIVSNEADGIEWLRNRLRDKPQTYQEIQPDWLQAINAVRKNDILPGLDVLLEENFIEESGGKWRLPNIQDDVDKDKLREKALLKEFKIYVEAASKPHGRIKEARVEAIRCGFKKCYMDKDFATIVLVGDKIPQNLLTEDEILLQFYDIARTRV